MARNTRIQKAEITGIYGGLLKKMTRKMVGEVPEPAEVMWHNRKVLNSSLVFGRKAQKWNACDENLKSFAHMAAVSLVGCSFCLDFGYFMAHNEGLDEAKAREVPRWREADMLLAARRPIEGAAKLVALIRAGLTRVSAELAGTPVWLNGAPGGRIDVGGEVAAALSLTVENGRITRIYAIWNPHKLARLEAEAALAR